MSESSWEDAAIRFADALASVEPTPGGGSAAGAAAAMGCALGQMAATISSRSNKIDAERKDQLLDSAVEFASLRARLHKLTADDAAAFGAVMRVLKLPKGEAGRAPRLQEALGAAAEVPLETARAALMALRQVQASAGKTVGTVGSDMSCAVHLLRAAALCALENVEVNAAALTDPGLAEKLRKESEAVRRAL